MLLLAERLSREEGHDPIPDGKPGTAGWADKSIGVALQWCALVPWTAEQFHQVDGQTVVTAHNDAPLATWNVHV